MTRKITKSKARKAATQSGAPGNSDADDAQFPIENRYDRNFTSNDIPKLIARWRFLEADRQYHAAIAVPGLEKCALSRHVEEQDKIVEKLLCTVLDNFKDVTVLMKFAIETLITTLSPALGSGAKSTPGLRMLKNVSAGLTKSEAKLRVDAIFREMSALEDARKEFLRIGA